MIEYQSVLSPLGNQVQAVADLPEKGLAFMQGCIFLFSQKSVGTGNFSFSTDISRSNNGPNNASNRRYYTFTLSAADTLGNIGTATAQFWVQ